MLLIVTPHTILNPGALAMRRPPKELLGRGVGPVPRGTVLKALFWRLFFENPLPRYLVALSPFPIILAVRPDMAFGLSQAPLLMLAVVLFIETYVLSISDPANRKKLIDPVEAAKGLDRLQLRGKALLTELAAGRGLDEGALHLVVEQSGLHRAPIVTLVSVQIGGEAPGFLDLEPAEQSMISAKLFDETLTEKLLHRINLSQNLYVRQISLETKSVSAHARLAALAGR